MNIQELSVGDWVKCNGFKATIAGYNAESGSIQVLTKQKNKMWFGIEAIESIPLTAEILEKNGLEFIDDGNDAIIFLCCDMYWARLCVGDCFWSIGVHSKDRLDAVMCDVKYVHQLQRAVKLAGIEKEIVL